MNAKAKTKKKEIKKEKDSSIWFISKVKIPTYAKNHVSMPISSRYLVS